jgi:hypothetical protein
MRHNAREQSEPQLRRSAAPANRNIKALKHGCVGVKLHPLVLVFL